MAVPAGTVPSTTKRLEKSSLPNTMPAIGMIRSLTIDVTILPNAPPMITPTARSITLPLTANSLNSCIMPMFASWLAGKAGSIAESDAVSRQPRCFEYPYPVRYNPRLTPI